MSFSVPKSLEFFMNLNLTVEERTSVLGGLDCAKFCGDQICNVMKITRLHFVQYLIFVRKMTIV